MMNKEFNASKRPGHDLQHQSVDSQGRGRSYIPSSEPKHVGGLFTAYETLRTELIWIFQSFAGNAPIALGVSPDSRHSER
jgi:hypothetical protein